LANVEIDEMFRFWRESTCSNSCKREIRKRKKKPTVSDKAAKILSNDDMPRRAMSSIKLLLDLSCDVFLDVEFLEGSGCDVYRLLLHLLAHVDVFYDGFGSTADEAELAGGGLCVGRWGIYFVCHVDGWQQSVVQAVYLYFSEHVASSLLNSMLVLGLLKLLLGKLLRSDLHKAIIVVGVMFWTSNLAMK
jgi:hypothetical protein